MKERSLMYKSLAQFIICVVILLLLATPLFYGLTKSFYAEDMIDVIEAVQVGKPIPSLDLEEDILHGIMIQFALITIVLGTAIVLMLRFISGRLWQPFDKTLEAIEHFKLENGTYPALPKSNVKEFNRLNKTLERLMTVSTATDCKRNSPKTPRMNCKPRWPYSKASSTCCSNNRKSPNAKPLSYRIYTK